MPVPLFRACLAPLLAALALAACQTSPPAAPEAAVMPDTDARVRIQGEAVYFEKILMPEGARLRVQLIDDSLADTPQAVLSDAVTTVGNGPYEFAIDVARAQLREGGRYGLHVSVSMPDGALRFVTDPRVPVTIAADSLDVHVGRIRLRHVQPD